MRGSLSFFLFYISVSDEQSCSNGALTQDWLKTSIQQQNCERDSLQQLVKILRTNRGQFRQERKRAWSETRRHFFSNKVVEPWNCLPAEPHHSSSLSAYKTFLKSVDLSKFVQQ